MTTSPVGACGDFGWFRLARWSPAQKRWGLACPARSPPHPGGWADGAGTEVRQSIDVIRSAGMIP